MGNYETKSQSEDQSLATNGMNSLQKNGNSLWLLISEISSQGNIGGTYDLGEGRWGERRGDLGPAGIAGITIGAVAVAGALAVTVFFCYYVHQKQKRAESQTYGSHGYRKPAFQNY